MRQPKKRSFPLDKIRRFLEPGPVILISSIYKHQRNIMACGWHMMLDYEQVGCFIWDQNESREMIRRSRECVINVPTIDLVDAVIGIGNEHGPRPV
jgi:flavin reductase (DIM6/NTAB) family NADH-FMN oxidoreductase RutF